MLGFLVSDLPWSRPGYATISGNHSKAASTIIQSARGCFKSGPSKQVSNNISSSRKLTWIPFHLYLTSLALSLFSYARITGRFSLVLIHSVCFPRLDASLVIIKIIQIQKAKTKHNHASPVLRPAET